jgi:hypothetical protein
MENQQIDNKTYSNNSEYEFDIMDIENFKYEKIEKKKYYNDDAINFNIEGFDNFNFMKLSMKLWNKIFLYIPQKHWFILRSLSRDFRIMIDKYLLKFMYTIMYVHTCDIKHPEFNLDWDYPDDSNKEIYCVNINGMNIVYPNDYKKEWELEQYIPKYLQLYRYIRYVPELRFIIYYMRENANEKICNFFRAIKTRNENFLNINAVIASFYADTKYLKRLIENMEVNVNCVLDGGNEKYLSGNCLGAALHKKKLLLQYKGVTKKLSEIKKTINYLLEAKKYVIDDKNFNKLITVSTDEDFEIIKHLINNKSSISHKSFRIIIENSWMSENENKKYSKIIDLFINHGAKMDYLPSKVLPDTLEQEQQFAPLISNIIEINRPYIKPPKKFLYIPPVTFLGNQDNILDNTKDMKHPQSCYLHYDIYDGVESPLVSYLSYKKYAIADSLIINGAEININVPSNYIKLSPLIAALTRNINFILTPTFDLMLSKNINLNTMIDDKTIFYEILCYFFDIIIKISSEKCFEIEKYNETITIINKSINILLKNNADVNILIKESYEYIDYDTNKRVIKGSIRNIPIIKKIKNTYGKNFIKLFSLKK